MVHLRARVQEGSTGSILPLVLTLQRDDVAVLTGTHTLERVVDDITWLLTLHGAAILPSSSSSASAAASVALAALPVYHGRLVSVTFRVKYAPTDAHYHVLEWQAGDALTPSPVLPYTLHAHVSDKVAAHARALQRQQLLLDAEGSGDADAAGVKPKKKAARRSSVPAGSK